MHRFVRVTTANGKLVGLKRSAVANSKFVSIVVIELSGLIPTSGAAVTNWGPLPQLGNFAMPSCQIQFPEPTLKSPLAGKNLVSDQV